MSTLNVAMHVIAGNADDDFDMLIPYLGVFLLGRNGFNLMQITFGWRKKCRAWIISMAGWRCAFCNLRKYFSGCYTQIGPLLIQK